MACLQPRTCVDVRLPPDISKCQSDGGYGSVEVPEKEPSDSGLCYVSTTEAGQREKENTNFSLHLDLRLDWDLILQRSKCRSLGTIPVQPQVIPVLATAAIIKRWPVRVL